VSAFFFRTGFWILWFLSFTLLGCGLLVLSLAGGAGTSVPFVWSLAFLSLFSFFNALLYLERVRKLRASLALACAGSAFGAVWILGIGVPFFWIWRAGAPPYFVLFSPLLLAPPNFFWAAKLVRESPPKYLWFVLATAWGLPTALLLR
jgi:hypothetical protein